MLHFVYKYEHDHPALLPEAFINSRYVIFNDEIHNYSGLIQVQQLDFSLVLKKWPIKNFCCHSINMSNICFCRPVGRGGGFNRTPFNAADHKYSVSVCCYYSSGRRNLIFWSCFLAGVLKNSLWCVAWTILQRGESTSLYKSFIINRAIQTTRKTCNSVVIQSIFLPQAQGSNVCIIIYCLL